jgi:Protein of unknown function (DUF4245)
VGTTWENGDVVRGVGGKSTKDLVLSMLPLAVLVVVFAGVAGMCSFSPGRPLTDRSAAPTVDAGSELARVAREVDFAVREPRVPDGWRANSFGVRPVGPDMGAPQAVRVGWLLSGGGYLRLSQSDAPEVELVRLETEQPRPIAVGAVEVGGVTWVRYPSVHEEIALVADVSGVRLLITGSAPEQDMRTLAAAVLTAQPLPR